MRFSLRSSQIRINSSLLAARVSRKVWRIPPPRCNISRYPAPLIFNSNSISRDPAKSGVMILLDASMFTAPEYSADSSLVIPTSTILPSAGAATSFPIISKISHFQSDCRTQAMSRHGHQSFRIFNDHVDDISRQEATTIIAECSENNLESFYGFQYSKFTPVRVF